jgi:hypothetical protein
MVTTGEDMDENNAERTVAEDKYHNGAEVWSLQNVLGSIFRSY